ncbi:MAG: NADP-dependent oxidoreductase [Candidatus Dormiibacterota bacterium]
MRAVLFDDFGGPEVLRVESIEIPSPGPGQIRLLVRTAGVNPVDGKIRSGAMEAMFPTPLPAIPGIDVAGIVDALGEGVTGVAPGDEVLGWADTGSYAEYALATRFASKPAGLSWEAAVTLPVAGTTALRVLRLLDLAAGETLLVHGAAGAIGTLAVQLAVKGGATVIGTASAANQDYVAELGATPTRYGDGLLERVRALAPNGVDAVFDVAGKGALPASIELRGGTDRIVTIADPAARELGVQFSAGGPDPRASADLAELATLAARGELRTAVAATYPLQEAATAQGLSDAGHVRGKLVLTVGAG